MTPRDYKVFWVTVVLAWSGLLWLIVYTSVKAALR
jgi:hypothetical protein